MKYVYDWIHNVVRTQGEMDLEAFFEEAHRLKLDGVELTAYYFPSTEDFYLRSLKRRALSCGLDLYAVGVGNNFCLPEEARRKEQVDLVKKWINVAFQLGAPCLRVFAGSVPPGHTEEEAYNWTVDALKACAQYAEEKGIVLALENHGGITTKAEIVLRILEDVGSEWVRHVLDTGNYLEPLYDEIRKTAPYAIYVHARQEDQVISHPQLKGQRRRIDYKKIRDILIDVDFNGYVSIEYEGEEDSMVGVPKTLNLLKTIFST